MAFPRYLKDPNAVLDYTLDWSLWLNGDTISTATWTVPMGITSALETKTTTVTTIWLSGGTAGTEYTVAVRVVTAGGRTEDRSFIISAVSR